MIAADRAGQRARAYGTPSPLSTPPSDAVTTGLEVYARTPTLVGHHRSIPEDNGQPKESSGAKMGNLQGRKSVFPNLCSSVPAAWLHHSWNSVICGTLCGRSHAGAERCRKAEERVPQAPRSSANLHRAGPRGAPRTWVRAYAGSPVPGLPLVLALLAAASACLSCSQDGQGHDMGAPRDERIQLEDLRLMMFNYSFGCSTAEHTVETSSLSTNLGLPALRCRDFGPA